MKSRKYLFTIILFLGFILFGFSQIKNLVMEGGGIRGIAYCGAVEVLEEENLLLEIENIAGTSVGGITAALLCVGYTSIELEEELKSIKFQDFNDGRGIFVGGISRTIKKFGWYRGVKITKWMNALLQEKTGIENFRDYISAFYNLVIEKLNRNALTEQDWKRTISISTCGIGPKIKKLCEKDVQKLIESGRSATCDYFIK